MAEHGLAGPVLGAGLGRHGLRDGRNRVGRRAAARAAATASSASPRCARCGSPGGDQAIRAGLADRARGARRRLRRRRRRSSGCALFDSVPARDLARRAADDRGGVNAPARARRRAATSTRSARSASAGRAPATRARWPSSGTSRPTTAERGAYPFELATANRPDRGATCGRWCAPPLRTSWPASRAGRVSARFHETMADVAAALVRRAARRDGPPARRAHGRLLPERAARRGACGARLAPDFEVFLPRARCPPATAASRSARRSWRTRRLEREKEDVACA